MSAGPPRFVLHLPFTAADLAGAIHFARMLARSVSLQDQVDPGEATVSVEDAQGVRHRLFCDRLLDGGQRCRLRADHDTDCSPGRQW
ncbi:MAG TPA: hypothetical protein VGD43_06615 [Micromonospora sp.]